MWVIGLVACAGAPWDANVGCVRRCAAQLSSLVSQLVARVRAQSSVFFTMS